MDYTIAAWVLEVSRDANYLDAMVSKRAGYCANGWIYGIRGQAGVARQGRV